MAQETPRPPWLIAAEHAALGEARAKALLLERFWVLESSVDVHGADFLIQRRLIGRHFLSTEPPRFGIVQVKFVQDGRTPLRIPFEHVCDGRAVPHGEFFLLVFTGMSGRDRTFLLSGLDIAAHFTKPDDDLGAFAFAARKLLESERFEVTNRSLALDRIEDSLAKADPARNRIYVAFTYARHIEISPSDIHDDYRLPLPNGYGDIPEAFFELKKRAQDVLSEITEAVEGLQGFLMSDDPVEGWDYLEKAVGPHILDRHRLTFDLREVMNSEVIDVALNHRRRLENARRRGVESSYLSLFRQTEHFLIRDLAPRLPIPSDTAYILTVSLDPQTLALRKLDGGLRPLENPPQDVWTGPVLRLSQPTPGTVEMVILASYWYKPQWSAHVSQSTLEAAEQAVRARGWMISRDLMYWLDESLLSEQSITAPQDANSVNG